MAALQMLTTVQMQSDSPVNKVEDGTVQGA